MPDLFRYYTNRWNKKKNPAASIIDTGRVSTHARAMFFSVPPLRLPAPFDATIVPAIPLESTWVVLTGSPSPVLSPMVVAATISAVAPCA